MGSWDPGIFLTRLLDIILFIQSIIHSLNRYFLSAYKRPGKLLYIEDIVVRIKNMYFLFSWSSGKGSKHYQGHTTQHKTILMLSVIKALVRGSIRIYT